MKRAKATMNRGRAGPSILVLRYPAKMARADSTAPRQRKLPRLTGSVRVIGCFAPIEHNPLPYEGSRARGEQVVRLGRLVAGEFREVIAFGIRNDRDVYPDRCFLTSWLREGFRDSFGGFARPGSPYEFRLTIDLAVGWFSAQAAGAGDDAWTILADRSPLADMLGGIDTVRVEQSPGAAGISELTIGAPHWDDDGPTPDHPRAKRERVVRSGAGFRLQPMRSVWRSQGRHVTLVRNPLVWYGFPDIARVDGSHLVCAYCDGKQHGGGGGLYVTHSRDRGLTWGETVQVSPTALNCQRIQRLSDGTLLLLADIRPDFDVVLYDSLDGGASWTNERWLRAKAAGGNLGSVPSRVTELPDGSWLLVTSWFPGMKAWEGTEAERLELYRSVDRGSTWTLHSTIQPDPPHSLSEASVVVLPDRRLLLFARENLGEGLGGVKGVSEDMGKTWRLQELPFAVSGRTCAGLLGDGRAVVTFRSGVGRAALWAWVGDPLDPTPARPAGVHLNDAGSVALRRGVLHIESDGGCGQFTQYILRAPDGPTGIIDLTVEARVLENAGLAATLSVPFAGKIRIFPDRLEVAHNPLDPIPVKPGVFHTYRILADPKGMRIEVDGQIVRERERVDRRTRPAAWTPLRPSAYALAFGNERDGTHDNHLDLMGSTADVCPWNVSERVTGHSEWRQFRAVMEDPTTGRRELAWDASTDGFPDQYQLDHILEVQASGIGWDQGYSGWVELEEGLYIVNYTDDAAPPCVAGGQGRGGIPWIRGTMVRHAELP